MLRDLRKARQFFKSDGVRGLYHGLLRKIESARRDRLYQKWIDKYDVFTELEREDVVRAIGDFRAKPLISILMPVYNVEEKWLRKAIESVLVQSYSHWEFCIADDRSPAPHIRRVLDEYAAADKRFKVVFRDQNGHISAASNSALELAAGEFTCLLDHDDEFAPHALYFVVKEINEFPETDMLYSDEDKIDIRGNRSSPSFKPDWSPDLFYSLNLITHLSVYRTSILRNIGGFRMGFEGSQDYDLGLRVSEQIDPSHIRHVPRILYHWRSIPGSVALDSSEKDYAHDRARKSIAEHFQRTGIDAEVVRGYRELHRVKYALPQPPPIVSVILMGSDTTIEFGTEPDYSAIEIIRAGKDFANSNAAAKEAVGSLLCFLDLTTTARDPSWLKELASIAIQKEIGAVGPKISYPNGRIKSAGIISGIDKGVGRAHHGAASHRLGNFFRLRVAQNVSALPVDCLVIRKEVFDSLGGFDADAFPKSYADVDLCFRLVDKGYRNVWTPWARLIQPNELEFREGPELDILKARWPTYFERDPFYNPNLASQTEDLSFAFPPRISRT